MKYEIPRSYSPNSRNIPRISKKYFRRSLVYNTGYIRNSLIYNRGDIRNSLIYNRGYISNSLVYNRGYIRRSPVVIGKCTPRLWNGEFLTGSYHEVIICNLKSRTNPCHAVPDHFETFICVCKIIEYELH